MGGHKPVPGCWVGDVDGGVAVQHLEEEGRLNGGVVREAGAQWVDNRRGTIAEVPGGRESRAGSGVTQAAQAGVGAVGRHLHGDRSCMPVDFLVL